MKTPYVLALASILLMACSTQPVETTPVNDAPEATSNEVIFEPFAFTLPEGASLVSQEDGVAIISVPDSKYEVALKMYRDEPVAYSPVEGDGIEVFHEGCSGYCMTVNYDGLSHLFWIEVESSTEPIPEDLDGVWRQGTEVDLDAFMNTVHLAE
ncbi:MAG: hypothetical protein AAB383_00360 [Patescibacteria group bacterium]